MKPSGRVPARLAKLVVFGAVAALSIPAAASALSAAISRIAPMQAIALYDGNSAVLNQLAAIRLVKGPEASADDRAQARKLLRRSFTATLLNPTALHLMGLTVSTSMEDDRARPWMLAASSVSARDSASRIWLALEATRRGDADQTIDQVDHALRSSSSAANTMIPLLIAGLPDPEFQRKLSELAKKKVTWVSRFLDAAVSESNRPDLVADVVVAAGGFPNRAAENETLLIQRLVTEGYYEDAVRFAGFVNREARQIASRVDIADAAAEKPIAPLSWQVNPTTSSIILSDGKPAILAQVERDRTAVLANKLLYSSYSSVRMSGSVRFAEQNSSDSLRIEVGCPTKNGTAFRGVGQPVRAVTTDRQDWAVNLAFDCNPLGIRFVTASNLDSSGNELTISNLSVRR